MAVRKSESRIPGGFEQAGSLGQAVTHEGSFALVSYLSAPLTQGRGNDGAYFHHIQNTYVVFVNTATVPEPNIYFWTILFFDEPIITTDEPPTPIHEINIQTEFGEYRLDTSTHDEINEKEFQFIQVEVRLDSNGPTLILRQTLVEPEPNIEALFSQELIQRPLSFGGEPSITRRLAYDHAVDFRELFPSDGPIPVNLVASLSYLTLLTTNTSDLESNYCIWESFINGASAQQNCKTSFLTKLAMLVDNRPNSEVGFGLCLIKPHFAWLLGEADEMTPKPESMSIEEYFDEMLERFDHEASEEEKIDTFNRIRFPKSCLKLSESLLDRLKKRHSRFINTDILQDQDCIEVIISEFLGGLFEPNATGITHPTARKVFNIRLSSFIQEIVDSNYIPHKTINIQILDVRSGKPISGIPVKRIRVKRDDGIQLILGRNRNESNALDISHDKKFSYTKGLIEDKYLGKRARKALWHLGYLQEEASIAKKWPDNNDAFNALKRYWRDRHPDWTSPYEGLDTKKNPPSNLMRYLVNEFNFLSVTDSAGKLKVQLPDSFLLNYSGEISIEIGFWEIPIAKEKSSNTTTNLIARSQLNSQATQFHIRWADAPPQAVEWSGAINNNASFGWQITNPTNNSQSNLKVGEKLLIKISGSNEIQFDENYFSNFYNDSRIHFFVFGMQWCQPVWQPIPATTTHRIRGKVDPQSGTSQSTLETFPHEQKNLPILVTRFSAPKRRTGRGRDYGMLFSESQNAVDENNIGIDLQTNNDPSIVTVASYTNASNNRTPPRPNPHDGIDYFAIEGQSPVFIPHGGTVQQIMGTSTAKSASNGYGITRIIKFGNYWFRLAHLYGSPNRDQDNPDQSLTDLEKKQVVMAGLKIGLAGRTYKEESVGQETYNSGPTHLHFEIMRNGRTRRVANPSSIFRNFSQHSENEVVFLNNDEFRLFPCDCNWPNGSSYSAENCAVRNRPAPNTEVSTECWAARNLHCPYMGTDENIIFRIQSQLTYLYEDEPGTSQAGYLSPKGINGSWGAGVKDAIQRFREIHRDEIYRTAPEPSEGSPLWQEVPSTDSETFRILNQEAPHPRSQQSLQQREER